MFKITCGIYKITNKINGHLYIGLSKNIEQRWTDHRAKYTEADADIINALFVESGKSLNQFVKTEECYVGYGTAYKMVNEPTFYEGK